MEDLYIPRKFEFTKEAERQNWLELERWASRIVIPVGQHNGNTYFIACNDALAWEKAVADITLPGAADDVPIQALLDAHPHCSIRFSTGNVWLAGTIQLYSGMEVSGSAIGTGFSPFFATTTINMAGASSGYAGGPTAPYAFEWSSGAAQKGQAANIWVHGLAFHAAMTGGPTSILVFGLSDIGTYRIHLSELAFDNTLTQIIGGVINQSMQQSVFQNFWSTGTQPLGASTVDSFISNIQGVVCTQTAVLRTAFIKTSLDGNTPTNNNIVLPQTSLPPSGTAGGDLAGTFPNPTVGIASGKATLAAGTVTVNTGAITANNKVFLTVQSLGTVTAPKAVAVTARVAGTSFTITSADATDTSVVGWFIIA